MRGRRVADRYAEALLGVAQVEDRVAAVRDELDELVALLEGIPELGALLRRPDVDPGRKLEALRKALGDRFSDTILALLATLTRHGRGGSVRAVVDAYGERADEAAGLVRAEARTAVPLSEAQRQRLVRALARLTGKRVKLDERVDPAVLAGVRLQVGHRLIDGSAAGRLARMREQLMSERGRER